MAKLAPGKHKREGVDLIEIMDMFPDEKSAHDWFAIQRWGNDGRFCPNCGSVNTFMSSRPLTFWCPDCRQRFSIRTNTCMSRSKIPLRKWAIAIYLATTSIKGVSSMKLHRDLKITQKSAWFMAHRIREALMVADGSFDGSVEVDETYIGGKEKNKHASKKLRTGRGPVGKNAVVSMKDRTTGKIKAKVVKSVNSATLQAFVVDGTNEDTTVYTDEARAYMGMDRHHETVCHSVSEYVNGMAHTNGIESFWATLKLGYHGTYHHMSAKHLHRYINEFSGRHNDRNSDAVDQMSNIVAMMVGKRLMYRDLING